MKKELGREIHAISNMIGRKIDEGKRQRGISDVSPVQTWIVRYLHEHSDRDIYQRDIEREFTITRSTVTGILQLMEKKDFIVRVPVPSDARLKKIVLTGKGEALYDEVQEHIRETEALLVRGMEPQEVATLLELLEKVKNNLQ